ncbi:MAG TPA: PAS domain S-box protein [Deltaproteobacteria bacterium]|nr:PAS domain S-box protein [Deltaproteobacteria bacterium]HOI06354.1 PAS domain S-box protein [Deltaproteobacteria bacterium]
MQAQSPPRQGPQAGLAGTGARPHTPGAPSGSRPGSLDASSRRLRRSVLLVTAALVAASWIDEVLDFPHLLFGAPATPMNWRECLIETSLALAVGLIVWAVLSRVLLRARQDDQERKRGKILSDILINESPMMFTAINPDGTILLMSGYALEKLGYREEEVIGKSYLSLFVPPREREEMEKRLGELFGTGIPARGENYFVAKDGRELLLQWEARVVYKENGEVDFVYGPGVDVTEQKTLEVALRKSEERYRTFIQNLQGIAYQEDLEFTTLLIHGDVEEITGYAAEDFTSGAVRIIDILHPEDAEVITPHVEKLGTVPHYSTEMVYRIIRKDGQVRWIRDFISNACVENGMPASIQGIAYDITKEHEAKEALRRSEEIYRLLAENATVVIWATDRELKLTYISPSSEKVNGYTPEELMSLPPSALYTEVSYPVFLGYTSQVLAWMEEGFVPEDKRTLVVEAQRYRKDGSTIWVEIMANVVLDEKGRPSGVVGVTRDITERKKAEDALRASEERYRLLADNIRDVIWVMDKEFRFIYMSPSVQKLRGYTPEEAMALPVEKMFPERSLEVMTRIRAEEEARMVKGISPADNWVRTYEVELVRKDGSIVPAEVIANDYFDGAGNHVGFVGVTRDITARRKAEISLQQSETRYRLLTEHIKDVIFALDLDFRYTYISPYVETMRGFTQEEAMAMPWEEVVTPRSLPVLRKWFAYAERMLRTEEHPIRDAFSTFEVEMTCKDGSAIWTEVTVSLMYEADNKPYGYVGITRNISERKKAEEDLLRSEERYRLLAENINDVIWAMDPNFRYTYISPSVEKMRGYTVEEAMSLPMSKAYSRGSYKFMEKILAEGLARQQRGERPIPDDSTTFEVEMNCKDGSTKWVEVTANAVFGQDGSLSGFVGVTRDISERRKAEESMRKSEERYRLLADNVNDVIWAMDRTLALSYISPSVEKLSGYTAEEVMVLPIEKVFTERSFAKLSRILDKSAEMIAKGEKPEGDSALTLNLEFIHKDGSSKWVEVKSTFILDEAGRPVGGVGVARDITERKRQEEALRRSEETYRTIFESTGTAMVTIMEDGILSLVNEEFEVLSGYPRQEIEGRMHWRAFVAPEDQERLDRYRRARIASGDAPKSYEFRIIDREGTVKDVSVTATIFPGTERILMSLQDITQSKLAAEELKHSREQLRNLLKHSQDVRERERTRVAREIHDELGQVLTGLKMDLSFLAKKLPENLSELRTKTNLMLRFVDMTIQSVKRITMDLRPGLLDHLGLVAAIEWQAEEFQKRTGIRYRINVTPEDLSLGSEHSTAVFRIFQETLTNISKYAHATEVKISLAERAGVFEMTVSDNGVGITREQMENPKSFGLMGIQERAYFSGGRARIFGQKGKGTTVKVTIPLDQMRSIDDTSAYRG